MRAIQKAAFLLLGLAAAAQAKRAVILADTNRDGRVDVEGNTDFDGRAVWSEQRGALFLANIADTDGRCSKLITSDTEPADENLGKCNDADGEVLYNPTYAASIRTRPIKDLSGTAYGHITIFGPNSELVRLFRKDKGQWTFFKADYKFSAEELRAGLDLRIDARDVRRPNGWDGKTLVLFNLEDGPGSDNDMSPDEVFTSAYSSEYTGSQQFVENIRKFTLQFGVQKKVVEFETNDNWAQDFLETGYTSMPAPDGKQIVLRIMIRSSQFKRTAGRKVFSQLRSGTVGAVQHFVPDGDHRHESMGNVEAVPPYAFEENNYPAGRLVMGARGEDKPLIWDFFNAQEVQKPIILETAWLANAHVDEFIQFLPRKNKLGWVMMVDDPQAGLDILERAANSGNGGIKAFDRPNFIYDPTDAKLPDTTIQQLLDDPDIKRINELSIAKINYNIRVMKLNTGIKDEDIIRVPTLYKVAKPQNPNEAVCLYPAAINGLVFANKNYLAPNPWGPKIDGEDIMMKAIREAYKKAEFEVEFIDDWYDHHVLGGEVHCGTNMARDTSPNWWLPWTPPVAV